MAIFDDFGELNHIILIFLGSLNNQDFVKTVCIINYININLRITDLLMPWQETLQSFYSNLLFKQWDEIISDVDYHFCLDIFFNFSCMKWFTNILRKKIAIGSEVGAWLQHSYIGFDLNQIYSPIKTKSKQLSAHMYF